MGKGDSADYVRVLKSVQALPGLSIPNFAVIRQKISAILCAKGRRFLEHTQ